MRLLKSAWDVVVAIKNVFKVMFIVWVWMPLARAAKALWRASFGPCCDNPKLTFYEAPGCSVHKCENCGSTRTHQLGGGF